MARKRPRDFNQLAYQVILEYMHYNFCGVHQTLRVTPAMEAGLSNHIWSIEELVGLLDAKDHATNAG